jgi:hypothetical protein
MSLTLCFALLCDIADSAGVCKTWRVREITAFFSGITKIDVYQQIPNEGETRFEHAN